VYLNLCRACGCDFASLAAFDRHRTGVHAYTYSEGLRRDPPVDDGRRCLDAAEMREAGMEGDARGRWRIAADAVRVRQAFTRMAA
jgi:hypothetical protein